MSTTIPRLLTLVTAIMWTSSVDAQKRRGKPIPEDGFSTVTELDRWASSTWGGGWMESLKLGDTPIHYTLRRFTSGIGSSELIFWCKRNDDQIRPFVIVPVQYNMTFRIEARDGKIAIDADRYDPIRKGSKPALEISPYLLPADAIRHSAKTSVPETKNDEP